MLCFCSSWNSMTLLIISGTEWSFDIYENQIYLHKNESLLRIFKRISSDSDGTSKRISTKVINKAFQNHCCAQDYAHSQDLKSNSSKTCQRLPYCWTQPTMMKSNAPDPSPREGKKTKLESVSFSGSMKPLCSNFPSSFLFKFGNSRPTVITIGSFPEKFLR